MAQQHGGVTALRLSQRRFAAFQTQQGKGVGASAYQETTTVISTEMHAFRTSRSAAKTPRPTPSLLQKLGRKPNPTASRAATLSEADTRAMDCITLPTDSWPLLKVLLL